MTEPIADKIKKGVCFYKETRYMEPACIRLHI